MVNTRFETAPVDPQRRRQVAIISVVVLVMVVVLILSLFLGRPFVGKAIAGISASQELKVDALGKVSITVLLEERERAESFLVALSSPVIELCHGGEPSVDVVIPPVYDIQRTYCMDTKLVLDAGILNLASTPPSGPGRVELAVIQFTVPSVEEVSFHFDAMSVYSNKRNIISALPEDIALSVVGGAPAKDVDSDGIFDVVDNCQVLSNPDQANQDGDSFGDVCDQTACGDHALLTNLACVCDAEWKDANNNLNDGCEQEQQPPVQCTAEQCKTDFGFITRDECPNDGGECPPVDIAGVTQFCQGNDDCRQLCNVIPGLCDAQGSVIFNADLNGDQKYDGQDADIVYKTRDSINTVTCGEANQLPCSYNSNKFYVCDDSSYRVVGENILYGFGTLTYTFNHENCPYVMEGAQ